MSRPVSLSPINKSSIIDLESSLSSSENASVRSGTIKVESSEQDTGDSRTAGVVKVKPLCETMHLLSLFLYLKVSLPELAYFIHAFKQSMHPCLTKVNKKISSESISF